MVRHRLVVGVLAGRDRLRRSRSVTMPGPGCSGSSTTAAPTRRSAIATAASRRERPGLTVRTLSLIPVLTCMRLSFHQVSIGSNPAYNGRHPDRHVLRNSELVRQATLFRRRALFDEALAVIEQDYADENLSLGAVARSIATSRRQLQRVFGERNTSFRAELQRVRMTKASELLHEGETPVPRSPARSAIASPPSSPRPFAATTAARRRRCAAWPRASRPSAPLGPVGPARPPRPVNSRAG